MELDPVDALSPYIETMQDGSVAIGETRVLEIFDGGQCGPGVAQFGDGCARTLTLYCFPQRRVGREQVVLCERGRLIEHGVRGGGMFHGGWLRGVSVIFGYFIGNGQNLGPIVAPWSSAAPRRYCAEHRTNARFGPNVRFRQPVIRSLPQPSAAGFACPAAAAPLGATYSAPSVGAYKTGIILKCAA
jgi:hypothetical protein